MPQSLPNAAKPARKRGLVGWALFDWATQPYYTLVVTFLFAPYFVNGFMEDPAHAQSLWAYATGAAQLAAAAMAFASVSVIANRFRLRPVRIGAGWGKGTRR